MNKLKFSGHETFACKLFWLKKGYDFIAEGNHFTDAHSVLSLGVGKNMVTGINYWVKSFGIIDEDNDPTRIGNFLFGEDGVDSFLEDIGSLWLLHYLLIKTGRASIYNLVYNEFTSERIDFTKEQLHSFLKRKCFEHSNSIYNEHTISKDISVFIRNYLKPKKEYSKIEIEEDFSSIFVDLDLLSMKRSQDPTDKVTDIYSIEPNIRTTIPYQVVLFTILDNITENVITFNDLLFSKNLPGKVFSLNREGLYNYIQKITHHRENIVFSQTAGNEVLQISGTLDKWQIINEYYNESILQSVN